MRDVPETNPRRVRWDLLHPKAREAFMDLATALVDAYRLNQTGTLFLPFEGYRSPERQQQLYDEGGKLGGKKVTNARAWESPHNYGCAVDFVPYVLDPRPGQKPGWSWSEAMDWPELHMTAGSVGLVAPIKWDLPHIEHPTLFKHFRAA